MILWILLFIVLLFIVLLFIIVGKKQETFTEIPLAKDPYWKSILITDMRP